jgi:hypothetical protein
MFSQDNTLDNGCDEDMIDSNQHAERRSAVRYPLELGIRFRQLGRGVLSAGMGRSLDVSSEGMYVWASTDTEIPVGSRLEAVIDWPVLLDGTVSLKLVTTGRVVRSGLRGFAVAIDRYEFRTGITVRSVKFLDIAKGRRSKK